MDDIDPAKIKLIEAMIKGSFDCGPIISTASDIDQKFVFNDGTVSYHLIIARAFLDDMRTTEMLSTRLRDLLLMDRLKENPNKIVRLNHDGQISVTPNPDKPITNN